MKKLLLKNTFILISFFSISFQAQQAAGTSSNFNEGSQEGKPNHSAIVLPKEISSVWLSFVKKFDVFFGKDSPFKGLSSNRLWAEALYEEKRGAEKVIVISSEKCIEKLIAYADAFSQKLYHQSDLLESEGKLAAARQCDFNITRLMHVLLDLFIEEASLFLVKAWWDESARNDFAAFLIEANKQFFEKQAFYLSSKQRYSFADGKMAFQSFSSALKYEMRASSQLLLKTLKENELSPSSEIKVLN